MKKSIYVMDDKDMPSILQYAEVMKPIMIKGIGYLFVSKQYKITPDLLLSIATSMERQGIESI